MTPLPTLPPPVTSVEVPAIMSPTALGRALDCSLAAVFASTVPSNDRLPPEPRAILGTVFHRLAELAGRGTLDPAASTQQAARKTLERLIAEREAALASSGFGHMVPLARTLSYPEFLDRRVRAIETAVRQGSTRWRTQERESTSRPSIGPQLGAERELHDQALRLAGRPDRIDREDDAVVIRDFKTGSVTELGGAVAPHVLLQMRLYGLLARGAFPGQKIRLVVEHQSTDEIPFTDESAEEADQERLRLLERLPPGMQDAAGLATIGRHCRWCDARHLCPRYRREAPERWVARTTDYASPLDVWGEVTLPPQRAGAGEFTLRLLDDARRRVAIVALDGGRWAFGEVSSGERVWMFWLEARGEVRNLSNEYAHPTNFRELATGVGERRAYRLKVFREARPT